MTPSIEQFFNFARALEGATLKTSDRGAAFKLDAVKGDHLLITPRRTGKQRQHTRVAIESVLAKFKNTGSWQPSDYKNLTRNASYTLALIRRWIDARS